MVPDPSSRVAGDGVGGASGDQTDLCAPRARTIGMCSLDGRNGGQPDRLSR